MTHRRPRSALSERPGGAPGAAPARPCRRCGAAPTIRPAPPGDEPLARVQERINTRRRQTAVVLGVLAAAGGALATGHTEALAVAVGCVAAAIALAMSLLMLASDRRVRVLELIAGGHGELPVPAVRRERRRLLSASHRAALARSLHGLAEEAPVRLGCPGSGRPLYTPVVLVALGAELRATARLLTAERVEVAGVALAELLLSAHDSPLYGPDPVRLRQALHRIAFALQCTAAASHADPHDTTARG